MRILEISTHKFERHQDNPKRFYIKNLSHGIDMKNIFKHRNILWVGLWFCEVRLCLFSIPN